MANQHPLTKHPLERRKDYLTILASMAWADGSVSEDERKKLEGFCQLASLDKASLKEVLDEASREKSKDLRKHFDSLKDSDLRFTILTDCVFLSFADGHFGDDERAHILKTASGLGISQRQIDAISDYVKAVVHLGQGVSKEDAERTGKKEAAELVAAGIPVEAVAIAGALVPCQGASDSEMKEVLKAFGIGLGIVTGLGPLVMLGLLGFRGVKWLFGKL